MQPSPEEWRPGQRVGALEIIERIAEGQGTYGVLHLVSTPTGDRQVLKSLNSDCRLKPDWIAKFRDEIALHVRLSGHPRIVTCHGSVEAFDAPHLLMEYLELGTLQTLIEDTEGDVKLSVAASILSDLCSALRAVHEAGFVYGDLSPLNVLLRAAGGDFEANLTDFGVARPMVPPGLREASKEPDPDTPGEKHSISPEAYWASASPATTCTPSASSRTTS